MADIGTLAWAAETGGRLTTRNRLAQFATIMGLLIPRLPSMVRFRLGFTGRTQPMDVDAIRFPDSAAAKEAEEHCRDVAPLVIVNHSIRTYLFGALFAQMGGLTFDEELFYVASLLHDVGLCEKYETGPIDAPCFAVRGAEVARRFAEAQAWDEQRQHKVAEAISLHICTVVPAENYGSEAYLLSAATALDVGGIRAEEFHRQTLKSAERRVPRENMKVDLLSLWKAEAGRHKDCRGHFLNVALALPLLVKLAPFSE